MKRDDFNVILQTMITYFDPRNWNEMKEEHWYNKFKYSEDKDFYNACKRCKDIHSSMPTPEVFAKILDEIKAERRQSEFHKDKAQSQRVFQPSTHKSEIARECMKYINLILDNKSKPEEIIDQIDLLSRKFPNQDWSSLKKGALKKFYACHN